MMIHPNLVPIPAAAIQTGWTSEDQKIFQNFKTTKSERFVQKKEFFRILVFKTRNYLRNFLLLSISQYLQKLSIL
jgi:hypothetical protein